MSFFGKNETSEEWTTVPFDEAFDLLQNNTFSRDEMSDESGIAYNIHYGDVLIKYGVVVDLSKSKVPYIRSDVSLSKYAQSSYLRDGGHCDRRYRRRLYSWQGGRNCWSR